MGEKIFSNKPASLLAEDKQSAVDLKPLDSVLPNHTALHILLSLPFFPLLLIVIFKELEQKQVNNAYRCDKSIRPSSSIEKHVNS